MKLLSVSFVFFSISALLYQLNCFANHGTILIENGVSYFVDGAKATWKYYLSFIENSHENRLHKLRKEKETRDLQRRIRIEEIEQELIEGEIIIDKSMPNYNNLLMMFGHEIPKQYELACQIDMMKGTIFVSESLEYLAAIVKEETGKKLEEMNMKYFIDKMIERDIYMDSLMMFYEQQVKHHYLTQKSDDHSQLVLHHAFKIYESAWNMNLANEFLKVSQNQSLNLSFIDYEIVSQEIFQFKTNTNHYFLEDKPQKHNEYKKQNYRIVEQDDSAMTHDPKCKKRPYGYEEDSIWKKYDKY